MAAHQYQWQRIDKTTGVANHVPEARKAVNPLHSHEINAAGRQNVVGRLWIEAQIIGIIMAVERRTAQSFKNA